MARKNWKPDVLNFWLEKLENVCVQLLDEPLSQITVSRLLCFCCHSIKNNIFIVLFQGNLEAEKDKFTSLEKSIDTVNVDTKSQVCFNVLQSDAS